MADVLEFCSKFLKNFFEKKFVKFGLRVAEIWLCRDDPLFFEMHASARFAREDIPAGVPRRELVLDQTLTVSAELELFE